MDLRYISTPHLIAEAGGDPWAINQTLQAGGPAQISALAQAFHDAGRCTEEASGAFEEARRRFEASWNGVTGDHPISDSAEVLRTVQSLGLQSLMLPKIGVDLENVSAALAQTQRAAAASIASLEAGLQQLDDLLGQALGLEAETAANPDDRFALEALICALEQHAIDDTAAALGRLRSQRKGYSDHLQTSLTTLRTDGYDPTVVQAIVGSDSDPQAPLPIPPLGASAEQVNRWWKTLSPQQQGRLVADHQPELGNLNGVPIVVRSQVNKAVLTDDLRRIEGLAAQHGISVDVILADRRKYGLAAADIARYANARRTEQGLDTARRAADQDVLLVTYRPEAFGGAGAAAIAIGDPDTAANTAVLVTGARTSVRGGTLAKDDGARLYLELARADAGPRTAVMTWVGYDAPNNWFDPELREWDMARAGGRALAADVNALWVTHEGAPTHLTIVGHSYGSTVVSDAAAAYGMRASDVVLVGSPGTDLAHSAADFHLPADGHLYVGAASDDMVTWSPARVTGPGLIGVSYGGLGDDPAADGYGSTRFKAEVPGNLLNPVHDHLHYFDDGSESLFSIADVVSGHGDALQRDGMTARHRGEYGVGQWFDPEVARPATTGHRHGRPRG